MTERSKNRKGYDIDLSCSNSEDADDDPDYIVRFSSRLSKENNSASFNENRRMKIDEEDTTSSSISRKRGRPPKRRNFRQDVQKLEIRMKGAEGSSNVSRRCRNSKRAVHQGRASISSWMINLKALQENQRVVYMDRKGKEPIKEGTLRRDGILCLCCYEVYTAENFQVHAGGKPHKPYEYIFVVDKRVSSVSCMIEAWNMPEESARRRVNEIETKGSAGDPYDDACMICADGGNLMCCDSKECSSTYHHKCMDMKAVPEGSWYCPYCVCKFCARPCQRNDYLLTCSQCEKNYHWECNQERRPTLIDVNSTPSPPFCDQSCKEVKEKLGKIVGEENKLADGYTWTLLQRTDSDPNVCPDELYRGTICNSKLGVAWRLINECFEPLIDRHTSVDMVQSVVYSCGSNFKRINFKSFYTAVLEKDDEIISVASLRIHGTKLAEMPFIATNEFHRRNGMCRRLLTAIESTLCFLKVEYLVIPSIFERIGSWIEGYGFRVLEGAALKKEIMCRNTLTFHDSVRLHKPLHSPDMSDSSRLVNQDTTAEVAENNDHQTALTIKNKSAMPSFIDLNLEPPECECNQEANL